MKPIHVIPNLHLILRAIENGAGISLIPTYLLRNSMNDEKAKVVFDDLNVTNKLFIAYQTKNKHLPEVNNFIREIREKW